MATPIIMPKQGNTVEECLLTTWRVKPGATVSEGDVLADIETDKAAFEVEATTGGEVLAEFFEEGDLVPVLETICVIGEAGEDAEPYRPGVVPEETGEPSETAVEEPEPRAASPGGQTSASAIVTDVALSPRARRFAAEHSFEPGAIQGSGAGGRIMEKDVAAAYRNGPRLSPVAAEKRGEGEGVVAPGRGTGVSGMIRGSDMIAGAESPAAGDRVEVQPLSNMRRLIADRMLESVTSTAQYTMHSDADATVMLNLRKRIKSESDLFGLGDVTVNSMLLYAAIEALRHHPELNAEFIDGELRQHSAVHLGFACDTPRGLLVPVIRDAHTLSLPEIAAEAKRLASAAVEGRISPDDLQGGTFTVSNLGALGVSFFTPIIYAPQVAILGVCRTELKPVRHGDDVEFRERINFSLTCNHQVVDGAPGARFLQTLARLVAAIDVLVLHKDGKAEC